MATRPVLPRLTSTLTRSVMHHARPPRVPPLRNPHEPAAPRATEGASTAHPAHLGGAGPASTSSSTIGDGLTLHHSPPPTAPSYTTGVVPELLRWTSGQQVRLTGEEGAPLRKPRASAPKPQFEWTQDVKNKIMEMRAVGRTRSEVADELNIPRAHSHRIAMIAPQSKSQAKERAGDVQRQKESWGEKKSLARAIRERRKAYW